MYFSGTIRYIANDKVDIVLTSNRTSSVTNLIKKRPKFDIIHTKWLHRMIRDGNLLGYDSDEIFYIGWSYKNCLSDELDKYGDSFAEETNIEKLKKTFEVIRDMGDTFLTNGTVKLEGKKYLDRFTACFDRFLTPMDEQSDIIYDSFLDEIEFKYFGGKIEEKITEEVNLMIFNGDADRRGILVDYLESIGRSDIEIATRSIIYD